MAKVFNAGDIVQFDPIALDANPDGYVVVAPTVAKIHYNYYKIATFVMIGLNDGKSYSVSNPQVTLVHCDRIKGVVPKKIDSTSNHLLAKKGGGYGKPSCCAHDSGQWGCEREHGHEGDHMAWAVYPTQLYPKGQWPQTPKPLSEVEHNKALDGAMEEYLKEVTAKVTSLPELGKGSFKNVDDENPF